MKTEFSKRSFIGAALGTMIEYYDYSILGIFLPLISPLFFPGETIYDSLVKGFYAMLIAMLARPLGGFFFGIIGDKYGRRKALLCSMYGIAIATIAMGLSPTFYTMGIWASVLMVATKAVQVFCFGGEFNGAGIFVVEHAKNKNEAFIGSLLTAMMLIGSLVASLIAYVTTLDGMPEYAWRFAFIFGGIIGIIGVIYRKNLDETPNFKPATGHDLRFSTLLKNYPYQLIAGIFMGGFATLLFTTILFFINPILMATGFISKQELMLQQSALICIAIFTLAIAGKIADKKSPLIVMRFGTFALIVLAWPLLWIVEQGYLLYIFLAQALFIIINEIVLGPSNALLKNMFPMQFRYRGASLSFTLGLSLVGGLTPVVENYLYKATGSFCAISLWLIPIGLGTYISIKVAMAKSQTYRSALACGGANG